MKKTLIITLALVFVLGIAGTAFANPYSDVPAGHWAYKAVNDLTKVGVVEGHAGKFMGNQTMTRYEMAAITARAMAKADKADAAQKATIDKLAVEFSKELNDLGVRVAKLEKNASNIKFTGDTRVRWIDADKGNVANESDFGQRVRLYLNAQVSEDVSFTAKFNYTSDGHTAFGKKDDTSKNEMYEAYATHSNLLGAGSSVSVGRMSQAVGIMGYYLDSAGKFDGVQAVIPAGDLTLTAVFADMGKYADVTDQNVTIAKVDYKASKDLLLKGWYFDPAKAEDTKIWGIGFNYAFAPDWKLLADYVTEDYDIAGVDAPKDTHVRLAYKGADKNVPGSWGAHVEYVKWEGIPLDTGAMNGLAADRKYWSVQYSNALAKNVVLDAIYSFNIKKSNGDDVNAAGTGEKYTRVQVNYMF